jgi:hypothetical protein
LGVGLKIPRHKKTAVTEPQEKRRPRPDMGCGAIGWNLYVLIKAQQVSTLVGHLQRHLLIKTQD